MEPFIGQICLFGFNFAPRGWAQCAGQLLSIAENNALFALLGTIYGGDGRTTVGLPDLRGRVPIGYGDGPGLPSYPIGAKLGSAQTTLTTQNMPSHNHEATAQSTSNSTSTVNVQNSAGDAANPANKFLAATQSNPYTATAGNEKTMAAGAITTTTDTTTSVTVLNNGGGQSFNNMQPFQAINYCIALTGIFPSRN